MYPQDFAVNHDVPFFEKMTPFFKEKSALKVSYTPKFEMLPTSLILFHANSSSQEDREICS